MPVKLFSLRNVPEDEADDIRKLLDERGFDYYETPPGNWGISAAIIWLNDPDDLAIAKQLINEYQDRRGIEMREKYAEQKEAGQTQNIIDRMIEQPIQFVFYILFILFILYVSVWPFLSLGQ